MKVLNTNLYLKILYLKFRFRKLGAKIKILSDLLENVYTSQLEVAEYESEIGVLSRHYTIHLIEIN